MCVLVLFFISSSMWNIHKLVYAEPNNITKIFSKAQYYSELVKKENTYNVTLILCPRPWPTSRTIIDFRTMVWFIPFVLYTTYTSYTFRTYICLYETTTNFLPKKKFSHYVYMAGVIYGLLGANGFYHST